MAANRETHTEYDGEGPGLELPRDDGVEAPTEGSGRKAEGIEAATARNEGSITLIVDPLGNVPDHGSVAARRISKAAASAVCCSGVTPVQARPLW